MQAVNKYGQLDLIVWPETYFIYPLITYDADAGANSPEVRAEYKDIEQYRQKLRQWAETSQKAFNDTTGMLHAAMLVGLDTWHYRADGLERFNSAAHLAASGELLGATTRRTWSCSANTSPLPTV